MNSWITKDSKLFKYFVTIFYVDFTPLLDDQKMLKRRLFLITTKLKSVVQVLDSEIPTLTWMAREDSLLYTKSIIITTTTDPNEKLENDYEVIIKSSTSRVNS